MESDCIKDGTNFSFYSKREFTRDGNYSTDGRIRGAVEKGRHTNDVVLSYKNNGTWSVTDNIVIEKIIDFKVNLEYVTINGSMTEGINIDQKTREELIINSEKSIKRGIDKKFSIININNNEFNLQSDTEDDASGVGSCKNQKYTRIIK